MYDSENHERVNFVDPFSLGRDKVPFGRNTLCLGYGGSVKSPSYGLRRYVLLPCFCVFVAVLSRWLLVHVFLTVMSVFIATR